MDIRKPFTVPVFITRKFVVSRINTRVNQFRTVICQEIH